jgi:hypothetical protein
MPPLVTNKKRAGQVGGQLPADFRFMAAFNVYLILVWLKSVEDCWTVLTSSVSECQTASSTMVVRAVHSSSGQQGVGSG